VWNVLGRSSIRARRATFRPYTPSSSWSMIEIQIVCDAVCHWIPWPLSCAHQHSSGTGLHPLISSTSTHQSARKPRHCTKLTFPVCHLFFRWRHYWVPTTCWVTLHSPFSSHFALPTNFLFYKVLQNLIGPWVVRVLRFPVYSYLCIRHSGT
jgi:hypothetical protein